MKSRVRLAAPAALLCAILASSASFAQTTCVAGSNYTTTTSPGTLVLRGFSIGNNCDDCVTNVPLPFPVAVYDQVFNSVNLSSNGNAQFISSSISQGGTSATAGVQRDIGSLFTEFACNTALANATQVSYTCTLVPVELMGFSVE